MDEQWRMIKGYEDYQISNFGRVKTLSRSVGYNHSVTGERHARITSSRLLKVYENNLTGYKFVQLYNNKKSTNCTIHRLVALNFIANYDINLTHVNHLDGNKHNNRVDNLEWCTNSYNHEHATNTGLKANGEKIGSSKLSARTVHAIKYFLKKGLSHSELSIAFKISRPSISLIHKGKSWKHIELD